MSENRRLDRIRDLRRSLKAPQHASLIDLFDEFLEIYEDGEQRLRALEKDHEDND